MPRQLRTCLILVLMAGPLPAQRRAPLFQRLTIDQGLSQNFVTAIAQDRQGFLWFGTRDGLNRYDGCAFATYHYSPTDPASVSDNDISSLAVDPGGIVWVGTSYAGLNAYDPRTDAFVRFRHRPGDATSIASDRINTLYCDRNGTLWIATAAGLWKLDESSGTVERQQLGDGRSYSPGPEITSIVELSRQPGRLWITSSGGVFILETSTGRARHYLADSRDPKSLSHEYLTCILEDRNGRVWIGATFGLNRVVFEDGATAPSGFVYYTTADGLPNDRIYGILEDDRGFLWVSTNRGLSRCDPSAMTFRNYDVSDGLQSNEFNFGAFHRAADGELFFGGINGVSSFYPAMLTESRYMPPVVLTGFQVFNQPITGRNRSPILDGEIPVATGVPLSYEHRVVSFEFASLDYTSPQKNAYAHMMLGCDDRWIDAGTQRRAMYTNLPAGSYTFLVKGSNSDGIWNPVPASILVTVDPPYWQTWWFRLFAGLALAVAVYSAHRVRTSAIRARNLALQREIGSRERTERALALAEEKFRTIFERALFGIFQTTPEGRFLSANMSMAAILGYESPEQLLAAVTDIAGQIYVDPKDRNRLRELLGGQEEVRDFQCQVRKKDGTSAWVLLIARLVKNPETGENYYEGMVQDITERKRLEEQLVQSQKLEGIGRLAGGVAHDFNNMLTVIDGYVELARNDARPSAVDECLDNIHVASERAKRLTAQLLAFARKQIIQPQIVSPNRLLRSIEPLLRRLIGEDVELSFRLAEDLWNIRIDPSQFEQIILNLAANARDSMRTGGVLQIESRNASLDETYIQAHHSARPGLFALITVSDTGAGIDKETLPHIFEPFFTTKGVGQGTGLGLATVYGIVKQNNGYVWAYSEPEKGTTFRIYLPQAEGEPVPPPVQVQAAPARGNEVILVVEDEEMVRNLAVASLRRQGYTVLAAPDGSAALEIVGASHGTIDLLVTDVVMPKMSGKQLAAELLKTSRDLRILFTSGYTENIIAHHGVLESGVDFLEKPYTPRDLANSVRAILDRRR